jgi:hypothetical protein
MVQIQIIAIKESAAVLAGVLVPLKNVVPGKFYFLFWQPIKKQEHDHARDPNFPSNGGDDFVFRRSCGEVTPTIKIMREKIICLVGRNNVGVAGINERESAANSADIDRLPKAIQH